MADSSKEGYSDDDDYDDDYDGENEDEDGNEYGDDGDNDGDGGDDDDDDDDRIQPGNQIAKSSVPDEDHLVDVGRIQFGSQMVDVKMHNSVPIIAIKTRSTLNEYSIIERLRHANIVGFDHAVAAGRIRESQIDYWLYILRPPVFATVSSVNAEYAWSPSDVRRVCDGVGHVWAR
ncbi:hypothetical protein F5884DRAFT_813769 [Xylogone sp. PMI_703]|nr:hypothetical protein F5884DRAFT_813769 [Xylogone sp. PMI_703]